MKINSKTTLKAIKAAAQRDFGKALTDGEASTIKQAAKVGSLLWSRDRLTTTLLSGNNVNVMR